MESTDDFVEMDTSDPPMEEDEEDTSLLTSNESVVQQQQEKIVKKIPPSSFTDKLSDTNLTEHMQQLMNGIDGILFAFITDEVAGLKAMFDCIAKVGQNGNLMFDNETKSIQVKVMSDSAVICSEIKGPCFFSKGNHTVGIHFEDLATYIGKAVKGETITIMGTDNSMNKSDPSYVLVIIDSQHTKNKSDTRMRKTYKLMTIMFSIDNFPQIDDDYDLVLLVNSEKLTKHYRSIPQKPDKLVQFLVDNEDKNKKIKLYTRVSSKTSALCLDNLFMLELKVEEGANINSVDKLDMYPLDVINHLFQAAKTKMITLYLKNGSHLFLKIPIGETSSIHALVYCFICPDDSITPVNLEEVRKQNVHYEQLSNAVNSYDLCFSKKEEPTTTSSGLASSSNNNTESDSASTSSSTKKTQEKEKKKGKKRAYTELEPEADDGYLSSSSSSSDDENDSAKNNDSSDDELDYVDVEEEEAVEEPLIKVVSKGRRGRKKLLSVTEEGETVEEGKGALASSPAETTTTAPKRKKQRKYKTTTPTNAKNLDTSNAEVINELLSNTMSERLTSNNIGSISGQANISKIVPSVTTNLTNLNAIERFRLGLAPPLPPPVTVLTPPVTAPFVWQDNTEEQIDSLGLLETTTVPK